MAQAKKTEDSTENNEARGLVLAYMKEQGAKSKKQLSEGGKEVVLSLTNTTNVRFTKDFGLYLKEGMEQEVSDQAFAIYDKAGVIEKV